MSGRYVDPTRLTVDDIDLLDIAHGLSHRCRFAGHTKHFYSVAAHSMRVAELSPPWLRLQALLHDASEAYLFDIPSPLKGYFPELVALENQVMLTIAQKFGCGWPIAPAIKEADKRALEEEWRNYVIGQHKPFYSRDPATVRQRFYSLVMDELDGR